MFPQFQFNPNQTKTNLVKSSTMAFTFAALAYIFALIIDAFLIFFAIFHVSNVSISKNQYRGFPLEVNISL